MKSILSIIALVFLAVTVQAAETKKKSPAKAKSEPAEVAKVPAKGDAIAKSLTPTQRTKLLGLLNDGDEAALIPIPTIFTPRGDAKKKEVPKKEEPKKKSTTKK